MTYAEAKAHRDILQAEADAASKALQVFPRGPMGLTPDEIKRSPEFGQARNRYELARIALQRFNTVFLEEFKTELQRDRRTRYQAFGITNGERVE